MAQRGPLSSSPVVALAGWLVPGAGYLLIGQVARGLTVGVTILSLFVLGILIAGIRVIDVPGYDNLGFAVRLDPAGRKLDPFTAEWDKGDWALTRRPLAEVINKPWYVGQVLTGPVCLLASRLSLYAARPADAQAALNSPAARVSRVGPSHARLAEIGSLYTAVAGMLNLLAIIDAASRAGRDDDEADAPAGGDAAAAVAATVAAAQEAGR